MTRRGAQVPEQGVWRPVPAGPPRCVVCGFTGYPTDESSPYIGCNGDPARHQRQPVGADGEAVR